MLRFYLVLKRAGYNIHNIAVHQLHTNFRSGRKSGRVLAGAVADPEGQSGQAPTPIRPWPSIQSDSLAINFEFDIIRKKCIHCGQLNLRKISKIGATRCQILRLKCIKFDFRWGSVPDPTGELSWLQQTP